MWKIFIQSWTREQRGFSKEQNLVNMRFMNEKEPFLGLKDKLILFMLWET